ncbi:hypothetical protein [Paraburkholderia caffeinilytica]|uniref:hypothetical protein n=1 Tax=Paraburkholderia caffeinilytica TaxID=1761016 RepID=UPI003DA0D0E9
MCTQNALPQREPDAERLIQLVRDLDERPSEHEDFRNLLEEKGLHTPRSSITAPRGKTRCVKRA